MRIFFNLKYTLFGIIANKIFYFKLQKTFAPLTLKNFFVKSALKYYHLMRLKKNISTQRIFISRILVKKERYTIPAL